MSYHKVRFQLQCLTSVPRKSSSFALHRRCRTDPFWPFLRSAESFPTIGTRTPVQYVERLFQEGAGFSEKVSAKSFFLGAQNLAASLF